MRLGEEGSGQAGGGETCQRIDGLSGGWGTERACLAGVEGGAQRHRGVMVRPGHTAQVSVEALEQAEFCPSGTAGSQGRYKTKSCPVAWKIPPPSNTAAEKSETPF